jgi:signal transduction histidine kinase
MNTRIIIIISIILIIGISYGIFFYLQNQTESSIRNSLFEEQKKRQIDSTESLSNHISSDLGSIIVRLQMLANYLELQQGESSYNTTATRELLDNTYYQISKVTPIEGLFILDKRNVVTTTTTTINTIPEEANFTGNDFENREWAIETKDTLRPILSDGFEGKDGKYRIALTYPIVNKTGQYLGLIGASIPATPFFEHYGNIYDIQSQYLAVLDRNSVQLIHPVKSFIGTPFFGNHTQETTGYNKALNNIIRTVMSGKPYFDTYEFRNSERLNTGFPIFFEGKPEYSVFVITPTLSIYSQINEVIYTQRLQTFFLLAGLTSAVVILIIFLVKWNSSLDKEVKKRTMELDTSNKQLKVHDKMQREFINIAAHELRTPVQPILGLIEILFSKKGNIESYKGFLDTIFRNTKRLQRLTEDILDITRIESQTLKLNKTRFNLDDVIVNCIHDTMIDRHIPTYNNNNKDSVIINDREGKANNANAKRNIVKIAYEPRDIFIEADKERISQVISNILSNAIKFSESDDNDEEKIFVNVEKKTMNNHGSEVIVSVKDVGTGIDPEILPRLFTKFASKSATGTGLGLYISKNILEAHGGKIWAENNPDGKGATFSFSLPIDLEK